MDARPRVLFLCYGNACRSPMAEGWLRHLAGDRFAVESAGIRPIGVHPRAVEVMREVGVDLSAQDSTFVHHHLVEPPDLLIALSRSALRATPRLPERTALLEWPTPDPYLVRGDAERVLAAFRDVRDALRERIEAWLAEGAPPLGAPGDR